MTAMRFSIEPQPVRSTLWLRVRGELDLTTADVLYEAIVEAVVDRSTEHVVIDLAGVPFLDCSGVGALVRGHTLAEEFHCRYEVCHATGEPAMLLGLLTAAIPPMVPPRQSARTG